MNPHDPRLNFACGYGHSYLFNLSIYEVLHITNAVSLSPVYGSSVGFDRFSDLFESLGRPLALGPSYPAYDIEKLNTDQYRISIAVPGFSDANLSVTVEDTQLIVSGKKQAVQTHDGVVLYAGIAARDFIQTFRLADYVTVTGAQLTNGILAIDLTRMLPEGQKPQTIPINADPGLNTVPDERGDTPSDAA